MNKNNSNSTLLIRADANEKSGIGHLMRCIALAQSWQRYGGNVLFLSNCTHSFLKNSIKNKGFGLIHTGPSYPDKNNGIAAMQEFLQVNSPAWAVLDGYNFTPDHHRMIRETGTRLLVLDDNNHLPFYDADILLNQNLEAEKLSYKYPADCTCLLGPSFTLLREEFLTLSRPASDIPDQANRLLLSMGGADPDNTTLKVILALNQLPPDTICVDIVIGPANPYFEVLKPTLNRANYPYRIVSASGNMPQLMIEADMAVSAGGSTAWELSYLGVPTIYIALAENQRSIIKAVSNADAGINAGRHHQIRADQLSKMIHTLIMDKNKRMNLSVNAAKLISGKGADNVVSRMLKIHR